MYLFNNCFNMAIIPKFDNLEKYISYTYKIPNEPMQVNTNGSSMWSIQGEEFSPVVSFFSLKPIKVL